MESDRKGDIWGHLKAAAAAAALGDAFDMQCAVLKEEGHTSLITLLGAIQCSLGRMDGWAGALTAVVSLPSKLAPTRKTAFSQDPRA